MIKPTISLDAADIRKLNKDLKAIEPDLLKEMRREIKSIAKPIMAQIQSNIPAQAPMSGMAKGNGRLVWFGAKKPDSLSYKGVAKATGRSLTTPLVSIKLNSAAASMADMAGRVGKSKSMSREYTIRLRDGSIVKRRHRVTTQGKKMISVLGGKASRYGWPALEDKLDQVNREIDKIIQKYYLIANRRI